MTTSIGHRWKCGNACSRVVLIARQACAHTSALPREGRTDLYRLPYDDVPYPLLEKYVVYPPLKKHYSKLSHYYVTSATLSDRRRYSRFRWPWRRGTPLTIPNREVKTVSADGTAIPSGRVGRRLARKVRASIDVRTFFFTGTNPFRYIY